MLRCTGDGVRVHSVRLPLALHPSRGEREGRSRVEKRGDCGCLLRATDRHWGVALALNELPAAEG